LGQRFPHLERYLLPAIALIVALSLIPPAIEIIRSRRRKKAAEGAETGNTQPLD
jgi:membrane-associated protein